MYISHKLKTAFCFCESTGSRAVEHWLVSNKEFEFIPHNWKFKHKHNFETDDETVRTYTPYLTVRHPFDRISSLWGRVSQVKNPNDGYGKYWTTFEEFCQYLLKLTNPQQHHEALKEWKYFDTLQAWTYIPMKQEDCIKLITETFGQKPIFIRHEELPNNLEKLPWNDKPVTLKQIGVTGAGKQTDRSLEKIVMPFQYQDYLQLGYNTYE